MAKDMELTVRRVIDADRETVFKALTDQKIMEKWFFAGPEGWSAAVENTPEVGGSYRIDMHGEQDTYTHTGIYKEIVPNEKLVFSWNSQSVEETLVTITLNEVDTGTEVVLRHQFMPNRDMVENHRQGWNAILERLERAVAG